jgi:hypothetical protein
MLIRCAVLACLLLTGCATPPPVDQLVAQSQLEPVQLTVDGMVLAAWRRGTGPVVTVVIEGDGPVARATSPDPTPEEPVALRLGAEIAGPVAVLARPCQYLAASQPSACARPVWTTERFSPVALARHAQALDQLKAAAGAREIALVGYGGGGVIAAYLAAQRSDVVSLITLAAPIDVIAWNDRLGQPRLAAPAAIGFISALRRLPQRHLWSSRDQDVPPASQSRVTAAFDSCPGVVRILVDRRHSGPWTAADIDPRTLARCPGS